MHVHWVSYWLCFHNVAENLCLGLLETLWRRTVLRSLCFLVCFIHLNLTWVVFVGFFCFFFKSMQQTEEIERAVLSWAACHVAAAQHLCILSCIALWVAVLSSLKLADMSLSSKGPVNFEELLLWFQRSALLQWLFLNTGSKTGALSLYILIYFLCFFCLPIPVCEHKVEVLKLW